MELGVFNLWLLLVPAYMVIWIVMFMIGRKRSKPIEDPLLMSDSKMENLFFGFITFLLVVFISVLIPIQLGMFFYPGLAVFLTGFIVGLISILSFSNEKTSLNTGGIYLFSRNPMYIGSFLMITGLNIIGFTTSIGSFIFLMVSALWVIGTHRMVLNEEKYLISKYGEKYVVYKQRTPRYLGYRK